MISKLEKHFAEFRKNIIGINHEIKTPFGLKPLVYADWTASGRMYQPIEKKIINDILPYVANTHTETTTTGKLMTEAYHESLQLIKKHVNASKNDVIICHGSGMTSVVVKLQRILGLKIHEKYKNDIQLTEEERPIVFVTHMEHHSNQTSWIETLAQVEFIPSKPNGEEDLVGFRKVLKKFKNRKLKIAAITSCSNVTGVFTPYYEIAEIMHEENGYCFVDFACSAPYIDIDMHPKNKNQYLDAIYFSPHKFLGGPGTSGVLVFNKKLYQNRVPDIPGGGTVKWTNPWGGHEYIDDIEAREDGGTPGFLQAIRIAYAIKLKEKMGVDNILKREEELIHLVFGKLESIPNLHILAKNFKHRLGVFSFYIDGLHYNLAVQLLNDLYGIQTRGGCSCAGTYGHYLLDVSETTSKEITDKIHSGDLSCKPGWIRMSIHPTMTNEECEYILNAIEDIATNFIEYKKYYTYNESTNDFLFTAKNIKESLKIDFVI